MPLFRDLLRAIPTATTKALAQGLDLLDEHEHAYQAARTALDTGQGPLGALRAFAGATGAAWDDEAAVLVETAVRDVLQGLVVAVTVLGKVATMAEGVELDALVATIRQRAASVGYQAAATEHLLRGWLTPT